jgi:alkanesulfonate monooxygenase SsuD/methylene tetrahydromethanopterin reductase-like flavin-dependent oxidoreductase (luciferase family)
MATLMMRFDLRVPEFAPTTHAAQYAACLEMCEWAERLGFLAVALSEHHGTDDGYLPAPVPLAAAILARTNQIPVNVAAVILPLHDPVRLAEECAVVDNVAPGRLSLVVAIGYRAAEFEMAGVEKRGRGRLLEEYVEVLRSAWTGEPFEWRGREIVVTPRPATPGGPMLMVGGSTPRAARRAARLGCGFFPGSNDPEILTAYEDEAAKVGFTEGFCNLPSGPGFVMVSKDPDATWAQIGPHALFDAQTYSSWQEGTHQNITDVHGATTWEDVRATGVYRVLTPDECVEFVRQQGDVGSLMLHPLMGGIPPDVAWESLELVESEVLPRIGS